MKIYAVREIWSDCVNLYFSSDGYPDGLLRQVTANLVVGEPIEKNKNIYSPSMNLCGEDAQNLFNALWEVGLRPHDGNGSGAQVSALKDHLKDLQRIIFDKDKP